MVTSDRKIKILDFGIAKQINTLCTQDRQLTNAGAFIGKPSYAAPELISGYVDEQNETTDIYALGILLFQLLVGKLPYRGTSQEILNQHMFAKMPLNEICNKSLRAIVKKATQKKQKDRYQSSAEFRVALEGYEKEIIDKRIPEQATNDDDIRKRKRKKIIMVSAACAAILLVVGVVCGVVHYNNEREEQQRIAKMLEERRTEMENTVLDSKELTYQVDSATGCTLKTAALITEEAQQLLLNGGKENVKKGLDMLEKVISKDYSSSSEAMMLKSILLYEDAYYFTEEFQRLKLNVDSTLVPMDNRQAHELMRKAVEKDGYNYKALYELGCDYYAGTIRTGITNDIGHDRTEDLKLALEYFYKGLDSAEGRGDTVYMDMFVKRIDALKDIRSLN